MTNPMMVLTVLSLFAAGAIGAGTKPWPAPTIPFELRMPSGSRLVVETHHMRVSNQVVSVVDIQNLGPMEIVALQLFVEYSSPDSAQESLTIDFQATAMPEGSSILDPLELVTVFRQQQLFGSIRPKQTIRLLGTSFFVPPFLPKSARVTRLEIVYGDGSVFRSGRKDWRREAFPRKLSDSLNLSGAALRGEFIFYGRVSSQGEVESVWADPVPIEFRQQSEALRQMISTWAFHPLLRNRVAEASELVFLVRPSSESSCERIERRTIPPGRFRKPVAIVHILPPETSGFSLLCFGDYQARTYFPMLGVREWLTQGSGVASPLGFRGGQGEKN